MPGKDINRAISECMDRLRGLDNPVAELARTCDELRKLNWSEADIHAVETTVLRLLSGVIDLDKFS